MDTALLTGTALIWLICWVGGYGSQRFRSRLARLTETEPEARERVARRSARLVRVPRLVAIACGRPAGGDHLWTPHYIAQLQGWAVLAWGFVLAATHLHRTYGIATLLVTFALLLIFPIAEQLETFRARRSEAWRH